MDAEIEERYENLKRLYEELDRCEDCPFRKFSINKPKLHEQPEVIRDKWLCRVPIFF